MFQLTPSLVVQCDVFVEAHFDSIWALLEKDLVIGFICLVFYYKSVLFYLFCVCVHFRSRAIYV